MRKRSIKGILIGVVMMILSAVTESTPIQKPRSCENLNQYENRNQVDNRPLVVKSVAGRAKDNEDLPLYDACISLFTEDGTALLATVKADRNGSFDFGRIAPGKYRLIARDFHNAYCVANALVRVVTSGHRKKSITLHLRAANYHCGSFADYR